MGAGETDPGEVFRMAGAAALGDDADVAAELRGMEVCGDRLGDPAKALGPLPPDGYGDGGHARGRRAGAFAVGEDVEIGQSGLLDEVEGLLEQRVGLGR